MAWVRFDPGFSGHRKRLEAGPVASWLWVSSVDYCVEHLTDGFLPEAAVSRLVPSMANRTLGAAIAKLVETHAWEHRPGGYFVHAFLEYQEAAEDVKRQREAGRERARNWRNARASRSTNGVRTDERNGARTPYVREPALLTGAVPPYKVPPSHDNDSTDHVARYLDRTGALHPDDYAKLLRAVQTWPPNEQPPILGAIWFRDGQWHRGEVCEAVEEAQVRR